MGFFGVSDYLAFVFAFLTLLFIPGPGNLAIMVSTTKGGWHAGLTATLGLLMGDQVLLWLAVAGVSSLLGAVPGALMVVQWIGATYLAWLGLRMLLAKTGASNILHIHPNSFFRQAFLITILNPKAVVFYMAFLPMFIDPLYHLGFLTFFVMALTVAFLGAVYCCCVVFLTFFLSGGATTGPRIGGWMQKIAGLVLLLFAVRMAWWK